MVTFLAMISWSVAYITELTVLFPCVSCGNEKEWKIAEHLENNAENAASF